MTSLASQTEHSDAYASYVSQLEKRVVEQEQLIQLLNEKLASRTATDVVPGPSYSDVTGTKHDRQKQDDRSSITFVGSRKSTLVTSVVPSNYIQYFVSLVNPEVSAKVLAEDLQSGADGLTSVKCNKMKTKHPSYASFHVTIPCEQSHLVESDGAWPEGSFVKNFSGRLLPGYIMETFDSNNPQSTSNSGGKVQTKRVSKDIVKPVVKPTKTVTKVGSSSTSASSSSSPLNTSRNTLNSSLPKKDNVQSASSGKSTSGTRSNKVVEDSSSSPKNRRSQRTAKIG